MYQNGFNYDPWTYRFFPFEISFFVIGIFSFRFYKKRLCLTKYILDSVYFSKLA
jgi:hypothetical protein